MKGFLMKKNSIRIRITILAVIFAAIGFAEGGEFKMAKKMMEEFHAQKARHSYSDENRLERLKPLRANK